MTLNTTTATAVNLTSNTGATINFNAAGNGLDITTTTGTGFSATDGRRDDGGTVTVQGTGNTITRDGTGTALNIANTTIGVERPEVPEHLRRHRGGQRRRRASCSTTPARVAASR